jgi:hypothetical protein
MLPDGNARLMMSVLMEGQDLRPTCPRNDFEYIKTLQRLLRIFQLCETTGKWVREM